MRSVSFSGQRVINYVDMWILLLVRVSTWILIQYLNILLNVLLLNRPPVSGVSSPLISGWALVSLLLHLHHSSGLSISILSLVLNTFSILLLSLNLLHRLLVLNLSDFLTWPILWLWLVLFLLHDLLVLELDLVVMHLLLVHVHEVIRLYLHLLKHGIDVWVVHCKLLSDFILLPHFLIDDSLVLLLVVGRFVSLMGSGLLAVNFWIDHRSRSGLDMPPLIHLLLWMVSLVWLQVNGFSFIIKCVVFDDLSDNFPDIILISHFFKDSGNSIKLSIRHIIIPRDTRDGVLRLEHECDRRVIHNDHICHRSS